jgi:hypothetical protein
MVDQRVAAEKQNGVGTPYTPPMTRRLKCRIDPEQSPNTCMLPGREMIIPRLRALRLLGLSTGTLDTTIVALAGSRDFRNGSYGYRPGRPAIDAVRIARERANLTRNFCRPRGLATRRYSYAFLSGQAIWISRISRPCLFWHPRFGLGGYLAGPFWLDPPSPSHPHRPSCCRCRD